MLEYLQQTKNELRVRNYSPKTIKAYIGCLKDFFKFKKEDLNKINEENIKLFLLAKQDKGYAAQTINLYLNAIKFFYREVLKINYRIDIKFAKRSKKLPIVLSRAEIDKIIEVTTNLKHKLLLALSYSSGLRVSEVISLKIGDLNLDELTIHIKEAKGKKDRLTLLSKKLVNDLRILVNGKNPKDLLFISERGTKLAERTAQKIFENSFQKANICRPATFHSLRHSFATHLLENVTDIRYIQELLGHRKLETTQVYAKVASNKLKEIKNPLDF